MNFEALIEYNKYTLTLSAACFVYALEKFLPLKTGTERVLVIVTLTMLFACIVVGVIIFAAATSAQHPKKAAQRESISTLIAPIGIAHTLFLLGGIVVLGVLLSLRAMTDPDPPKTLHCCVSEGACKKQ